MLYLPTCGLVGPSVLPAPCGFVGPSVLLAPLAARRWRFPRRPTWSTGRFHRGLIRCLRRRLALAGLRGWAPLEHCLGAIDLVVGDRSLALLGIVETDR